MVGLETFIKIIPYSLVEELLKPKSDIKKQIKWIKKAKPSFFDWIAEKRLLSSFHRAATRVPYYKEYLALHNVDNKKINTIHDIRNFVPPIDKKNYVHACSSITSLCIDGRIEQSSLLVKSSGFSGKAWIWPKGGLEEKESQIESSVGFEYVFNPSKYKTLVVNTFLLGSWVAGTGFNRLAINNVSLCSPGPRADEAIEIIKQCKSLFDQIIITGYPPFLKLLVDSGIKENVGWDDKNIRFIFIAGGEGFSEGWRDYMNRCLDTENRREWDNYVISGFGASELGITGCSETFDSVRIRRAAQINTKLAEALFGNNDFGSSPMLFQYNPLKYFITVNQGSELEFSTISPNILLPLIRYNIHDVGGIISNSEMQRKLKAFGFDSHIDVPYPFFYVFGRSTGEMSLNGVTIYPENVKDALFIHHEIAAQISGRFKMVTEEDRNKNITFYIDIELKNGYKNDSQLSLKYQNVIHHHLLRVNPFYREIIKDVPKAAVKVRLREEGELENAESIKNHYI